MTKEVMMHSGYGRDQVCEATKESLIDEDEFYDGLLDAEEDFGGSIQDADVQVKERAVSDFLVSAKKLAGRESFVQRLIDCVKGNDAPRLLENLLVAQALSSKLDELPASARPLLLRAAADALLQVPMDTLQSAKAGDTKSGRAGFQFSTSDQKVLFKFPIDLLVFINEEAREDKSYSHKSSELDRRLETLQQQVDVGWEADELCSAAEEAFEAHDWKCAGKTANEAAVRKFLNEAKRLVGLYSLLACGTTSRKESPRLLESLIVAGRLSTKMNLLPDSARHVLLGATVDAILQMPSDVLSSATARINSAGSMVLQFLVDDMEFEFTHELLGFVKTHYREHSNSSHEVSTLKQRIADLQYLVAKQCAGDLPFVGPAIGEREALDVIHKGAKGEVEAILNVLSNLRPVEKGLLCFASGSFCLLVSSGAQKELIKAAVARLVFESEVQALIHQESIVEDPIYEALGECWSGERGASSIDASQSYASVPDGEHLALAKSPPPIAPKPPRELYAERLTKKS